MGVLCATILWLLQTSARDSLQQNVESSTEEKLNDFSQPSTIYVQLVHLWLSLSRQQHSRQHLLSTTSNHHVTLFPSFLFPTHFGRQAAFTYRTSHYGQSHLESCNRILKKTLNGSRTRMKVYSERSDS